MFHLIAFLLNKVPTPVDNQKCGSLLLFLSTAAPTASLVF